jgi:hypothetical protein
MMRILLAGILLITLVLSGCSTITGGSTSEVIPPPEDEFRYETSRTVVLSSGETRTIPTDFTLLESTVNINHFCAGCRGDYYIKFWYVPLQTDYFYGDHMTDGKTTDFGILSKGLYKNDSLSITYLDNVYSVDFRDKDKNKIIIEATLVAQSYSPDTKELIISGFPEESQNYFSVTYFHNELAKFNIYYEQPAPMSPGFDYVAEALSWVDLPKTQTVLPFTVRCAPVSLVIPETAIVPNKFEFCIGVAEAVSGTGSSATIARGLQERWLVSCREVS